MSNVSNPPFADLRLYDSLLDLFMPPGFVVDQDGSLVESFAGAEKFLQVPARRPSGRFLDMVPSSVASQLTDALNEMKRGRAALTIHHVIWGEGEEQPRYTLELLSFPSDRLVQNRVLICLKRENLAGQVLGSEEDTLARDTGAKERIRFLEAQLKKAEESLKVTVDALEASNEELQATNEELVASNEQFQHTNEELHSVNEELHTVNTEYQRKIDELSELNRDFTHLLEGMEVGTLFLDAQLRIRKYTPGAAELFNLVPHDIGREVSAFSHQLSYADLISDMERVSTEGVRVEKEAVDGSGRPVFVRLLPYHTARGIDGVVLTVTDISALREARERGLWLAALVDSAHEAIIGYTLEGRITSWNTGAERLFGYTSEELVGRNVDLIVPANRRLELEQQLARFRAGERSIRYDTVRRAKNGELIEVAITASATFDEWGKLIGVSAIDRDVREENAFRRRLAASEQKYLDLYDNAPEMYVSVDVSTGEVVECNARFLEQTGYRRNEVKGHSSFTFYSRESLATAHSALEQVKSGEVVTGLELEVVRKDGSVIDCELTASGVVNEDGQVVRSRSVLRDVTERKIAERQIRENQQIQEQFIGMVAHELRNPLHAIDVGLQILNVDNVGADSARRAHSAIVRQVRHMARLVNDLLDVARISDSSVDLKLRTLDVVQLVRDSVLAHSALFEDARLQLVLDASVPRAMVMGDSDRLTQVMNNLLGNALRFSEPGQEVCVKVRLVRPRVVIEVIDNGRGIPRDALPRIFERFYQVDPGLARTRGGLGLGLFVTKRLLEAHSGTIRAESEGEGKGASFIVELPARVAETKSDPLPATGSLRIAIVEDQPDASELMRIALENLGHEVETADTGEAGLNLLLERSFDIAFIDIGLPGMNGYEVAQRFREVFGAGTALVALTGYCSPESRQRAMEAGFARHLTKPVSLKEVRNVVADLTERSMVLD